MITQKAFAVISTCLMLLLSIMAFATTNSRIEGVVKDAKTGEVLPGANIFIIGTSRGAATNSQGEYTIQGIPPGTYQLRATYIGYKPKQVTVRVVVGESVKQDFALEYVGVKGESVVVTAQAEGQMKAINQQLSSTGIVNVVSSARIQELPDANAAESIGRLPGVSITRVGGEGNKVAIRGLAPKYNVIKIDGIRMAASNSGDRSTDLSMISSNMLEAIEVSKTVTADQDGDVLGGTVNFKLREARKGKRGLGLHLLAQGGYTGLSNAYNKYDNYKFIPSIEGRIWGERLGIFLQANLERRNLTSNEFGAQYTNKSADQVNYITQSISLHYIFRDRKRSNGALVMDYRLPGGKISFSNFLSSSITDVQNRFETFDINSGGGRNQHVYALGNSNSTLTSITNVLKFEKQLPIFHANLKLSHSFSQTKNPDDWTVTFRRSPAGIGQFENVVNLDPKSVIDAVKIDVNKTRLNTITTNDNLAKERAWMGALDLDFPLTLSDKITSLIKFGGKYRTQKRSFNSEVFGTNATFISPSARGATQMIIDHFGVPTHDPTAIPLTFFADESFSYGTFLDGDFDMHTPLNFDLVQELVHFSQENVDNFKKAGAAEAFARNNYLSNTNNYAGTETMTAAYIMATVNIGPKITVIPGIRFQNLRTTYSGTRGQQTALSYYKYDHSADTTVTVNHPYWLPDINFRYKISAWLDMRLAYSTTLSYPDFNTIIPRIDVTTGADLAWNNYKLKPSRSRNYDLYFTFSGNKIGFFSIGGFLKRIDNLIYPWKFSKAGLEAKPYYLPTKNPAAHLTYNISTFINNPFVINDWGVELDWQTHFWYFPSPFKGLVLNVNYTHVHSRAEYPFVYAGATSATNIDTSFVDRLIFQPNHIFNLSLGYDYKDFSLRVSLVFQDDVFTGVSQWPQLRSTTAAYTRWDLSVKQNLPFFGIQLYGDINNLNQEKDLSVLQMYPKIPRSVEMYGLSADIGFRWQF